MTVYELSRDQLDELKSAYFWDENTGPVYDADGLPALFPGDIPDKTIYHIFAYTYFVNDDFFCTADI